MVALALVLQLASASPALAPQPRLDAGPFQGRELAAAGLGVLAGDVLVRRARLRDAAALRARGLRALRSELPHRGVRARGRGARPAAARREPGGALRAREPAAGGFWKAFLLSTLGHAAALGVGYVAAPRFWVMLPVQLVGVAAGTRSGCTGARGRDPSSGRLRADGPRPRRGPTRDLRLPTRSRSRSRSIRCARIVDRGGDRAHLPRLPGRSARGGPEVSGLSSARPASGRSPMANGVFQRPDPRNEPVLTYAPGTPERVALKAQLARARRARPRDPARHRRARGPHRPHRRGARAASARSAARALAPGRTGGGAGGDRRGACAARKAWAAMAPQDRAAIFLKAADLLAGPWRQMLNAATMLGQSKTPYQAEIDAACEIIDFWRWNPHFMERILADQPLAARPVEQARVPAARGVRLRGDAVQLHRPSPRTCRRRPRSWATPSSGSRRRSAVYSAWHILKLLEAAGLPPGVINFVPGSGRAVGDPAIASPDLAGVHFTGSTGVFQGCGAPIGENLARTAATRASSARRAARTSSSCTRPPTWTPPPSRSSAARSSSRDRSAPPRRARTSREPLAAAARAAPRA